MRLDEKHPESFGCPRLLYFRNPGGEGYEDLGMSVRQRRHSRDECFQPAKLNHYNNVLSDTAKGTPVTDPRRAAYPQRKSWLKPSNVKEADFVEQHLIAHALSKNNDLMNKKDTKFLRDLRIPGVLNSPKGKPSVGASLLRLTLGI